VQSSSAANHQLPRRHGREESREAEAPLLLQEARKGRQQKQSACWEWETEASPVRTTKPCKKKKRAGRRRRRHLTGKSVEKGGEIKPIKTFDRLWSPLWNKYSKSLPSRTDEL